MIQIFMIVAPGVPLLVLIALFCGIKLLRQSRTERIPQRRQALAWAGASLIEPLINTFLVFALILLVVLPYPNGHSSNGPEWSLLPPAMLVTLPMLFLLMPLRGWNISDAPSRDLNRMLVGIGLLRWAVTVFGLIYLPIVLMGMVVLGISIAVISSLGDAVVNAGNMAGIAVGLGAQGVRVGPPDEFDTAEQARVLL